MTLTQALIVVLLVVALAPVYLLWLDPALLGRFLSSYEEQDTGTSCVLRIASLKGGGDEYALATGLAAQGNDRYVISVLVGSKRPTEVEIQSYCATLTAIVDHLRRPEAPAPTFPSGEPLIWHYPSEGSP
jgi:hypothetical protein